MGHYILVSSCSSLEFNVQLSPYTYNNHIYDTSSGANVNIAAGTSGISTAGARAGAALSIFIALNIRKTK